MPVSWITRVGRMIHNGNRHVFPVLFTIHHTPPAPGAPYIIPGFAFAGQKVPADTFIIQHSNLGRNSLGIRKDLRLIRRYFKLAGHADAKHAFLVILHRHLFLLGGQRCYPFYDTAVIIAAENKRSGFFQQHIPRMIMPVGSYVECALVFTIFRAYYFLVADSAILWLVSLFNGVGVVPEVQPVHITIVEPYADMVWVIRSFTR